MELPFYKYTVNDSDNSGMDFNAFVDYPAHEKDFVAFGKAERYTFNEDKRTVTGVMISANTPIYRKSKELGEHYAVFDAKSIELIANKFFKNNFSQNVNAMHDPSKVIQGAIFNQSYFIHNSDSRYPQAPEIFKGQNLEDGTWIGSYFIESDELLADIRAGKFKGFSVEGYFDKQRINVKSKYNKMVKKEKNFFEYFGFKKANDEKTEFASATTADGAVIMFDGELAEGSVVTLEDGTPAPAGDHEVTLEGGSVKLITLDEAGIVTSIEDFVANEETPLTEEAMQTVLRKLVADIHERFEKLEASNEAFRKQLATNKEGEKFAKKPLTGAGKIEGKKSLSDLINKK